MADPVEQTRWRRVEALVDELLDLEAGERVEALGRRAATDPEIAADARRWLEAMGGDDALGDSAANSFPDLVAGAAEDAANDRSGTHLGPYRLTRVLGRGGMGVVYLAERADREFEKRVAVKLMPRGLESEERERRFRLERQVLAHLEHPNIARLLDGGVTEEGYPYLVMELVEGEPIDLYCEARGLGLEERLRLFLGACEGVQHAHQNLVIHRDLKPANILVTADGAAKLLDFGVAKLTEERDEATEPTRFQPRTTAWASPEQLANEPVSTATDVYSLGVVLYRLLAGRLPSDGAGQPLASQAAAPSDEHGEAASWSARLAGDLDRILAKAMAPEPGERYATVSALAEDLRRFLAGEPVAAREPTVGYRIGKFVSRHRLTVLASLAAVLALTAALVAALWQADRARAEATRAQRIADLLQGLFVDSDPYGRGGAGEFTVPDLLERGLERVRGELADDPEVRSELLKVLGDAFCGIGRRDRGIPLLEEVVAERRERLGERHPSTAKAMGALGYHLLGDSRAEEAEPLLRAALEIRESRFGRDAPETLGNLFNLGLLHAAKDDRRRQEEIFERLVGLYRRHGRDPSSGLALALGQLSIALDAQGRDAESLELQRQALAMAEQTMGRTHPFTSTQRNNLALRLNEAGAFEQAEVYLRQALEELEGRTALHEEEIVAPLSNLGKVLLAIGDFAAARPHLERAAEIATRVSPPEDFTRIGAEINLATLYRELGRFDEAEAIYRDALHRFEARLGAEHQASARARALLGMTLALAGDVDAAEPALRAALAVQRDPERDPMSLDETLLALGRLLVDRGAPDDLDEAESLLAEALALRRARLPEDQWKVAEVELESVLLAQARGEAPADSARLGDVRRRLASALPQDDFRIARASSLEPDSVRSR